MAQMLTRSIHLSIGGTRVLQWKEGKRNTQCHKLHLPDEKILTALFSDEDLFWISSFVNKDRISMVTSNITQKVEVRELWWGWEFDGTLIFCYLFRVNLGNRGWQLLSKNLVLRQTSFPVEIAEDSKFSTRFWWKINLASIYYHLFWIFKWVLATYHWHMKRFAAVTGMEDDSCL